jgi:hypothetical protein
MYPEVPVTNIFILFAAINAKSELVADLEGLPLSSAEVLIATVAVSN